MHDLLCISSVDKTTGIVFEVRRETGLVSVRLSSHKGESGAQG